ncbi:hypothetical protein M5689_016424 [Euphorbia peplus]|nr:hypothetical protein M5689_016424 [Euphorbia peplus]
MDSDQELPFSDSENQPSPVPERKLKRLRKAADKVSIDLLPSSSSDDVTSGHEVDSREADTEDFEVVSPRSGSKLGVVKQGFELDCDVGSEEVRVGVKRHLEFGSLSEEFDRKAEDGLDVQVEEIEHSRVNDGPGKKWTSLGGFEEVESGVKRHLGFDSEFDGEVEDKGDAEMEETVGFRTNEGSGKKWRSLERFEEVESGVKRHLGFDSLSEEFYGEGEDKRDAETEEIEVLGMNEGSEKKWRSLGFDSFSEKFDGEGEDKGDAEMEESEGLRKNEGSEKKRKNLDESEETGEKKRKKKKKVNNADAGYDENLFSDVSPKRIGKKERRERLKELRAESQRLLRETREASFKPVPIVQKSVSSVLEKIRQRKQELSKKLVNMSESSYADENDTVSREVHNDADEEELTSTPDDLEGNVEVQNVQGSKETSHENEENVIAVTASADDLKQTFRAPIEDTQDLIFDSPSSDSKDEIPSSPLDDILAPSLAEMNLKFDSALPDDLSDDEEDTNKNIDPLQRGSADLTSSRKGDPVKAFVDDEAEEEDDSDDDRARFQNNEEEEDDSDIEELNDMIATAYEEKPVDNDMRNQLHQKWLEQQDSVGTENLLQKLNCGSKQKEMDFMEEKEEEESDSREDEESEDESDNDPAEGLSTRNIIRMNLKKAKEMMPLMFTDKDDKYVSSDDEEPEKTSFKRHVSHKSEEHSTFLSPAEDASSKDIFGLIKKLNGAPDARRKAKTASYPNTPSLGGNKTSSSKLSFLSRGSRNSLPSFQKQGSTVRSFIFERDDSNSRSAILTAEDSSDAVQWENRPKKAATAKFSNSQSQVRSSQTTQNNPEKDSGPSLHEILRCSSIKSSHRNGDMTGQVEAIYAAFKLDHYPRIKREPGLSLRTV